jgi:hypothetical protein
MAFLSPLAVKWFQSFAILFTNLHVRTVFQLVFIVERYVYLNWISDCKDTMKKVLKIKELD